MIVHPAVVLFAAAAVICAVPARARGWVLLAGSAGALVATAALPGDGLWMAYSVAGYRLELLRTDPLSRLFAHAFALVTVIGSVFALHSRRATELAAVLVQAGGAIGVALAGDWISALVFWELMSVASLAVIWHGDSPQAGPAGLRYLLVHVLGGSLFFAGLVLHVAAGGEISLDAWLSTWHAGWSLPAALVLAAVAINAAIPPLHAWLTDAYPEASAVGTVFLSAFTTKTAVYLLIRAFPGSDLLLVAGVGMALYGVVYAVLENDIRRLLAYHIISQVGYMVAGVGMGTPMSLNGSAVHAFCHILYKALLLMGAGAVLAATGRRKLTELGGLSSRMPSVTALYMIGAFSISSVPLFNGFVSKAVIVSAAAEGGWPAAELLLTVASVGTFLHTGLKLPYFTFFGVDRGIQPARLPANMVGAMALAAAACFALGVFPQWLYARVPFRPFDYHPYTVDHIASTAQLLLGTGACFWWLLGKLEGHATISVDTDWLYRRLLGRAITALVGTAASTGDAIRVFGSALSAPVAHAVRLAQADTSPHADPYRLPVGATMVWVLASLLLLAFLSWGA